LKYKFTEEGQAKLNAGVASKKDSEKPVDKLVWARPGTLEFDTPQVSIVTLLFSSKQAFPTVACVGLLLPGPRTATGRS
jgi:hypothetical protein